MKSVLGFVVSLFLLCSTGSAQAQVTNLRDALVGTWVLVGLEREEAGGERTRTRGQRGVLILDRAGNVFEFFSTSSRNEPEVVPEDPQRTLRNFGGFWGTYTVDSTSGEIAFLAKDGVSPDVQGQAFVRQFEQDGDGLVLTSGDEPQAQGHNRWTWQRLPVVEHLTPAYAQVVGFWQHIEERQVNQASGEVLRSTQRAPSVIVYTPSGFVGVHFPPQGREAFSSDPPAAEEAQAGLRGYIGYFGTLGVFPGEVSHNVLSGISPGTGAILRRYAAINGDELVVTLQSGAGGGRGNAPRTVTEVVLRRLSDAQDMLPR